MYNPGDSRKALTLDMKVRDLLSDDDGEELLRRKTTATRAKLAEPSTLMSRTAVGPGLSAMVVMVRSGSNLWVGFGQFCLVLGGGMCQDSDG